MDVLAFLLVALVLLGVVAFVTAPLRRPEESDEALEDPRVADLEARKEAKYREIRDAEQDRASGKLSPEDFERQDAELRAEAIEILDELDRARGRTGGRGDSGATEPRTRRDEPDGP
jgi:flagellar biosynthesis/type III secretory pathway M-ring protein FliF/YscJ